MPGSLFVIPPVLVLESLALAIAVSLVGAPCPAERRCASNRSTH